MQRKKDKDSLDEHTIIAMMACPHCQEMVNSNQTTGTNITCPKCGNLIAAAPGTISYDASPPGGKEALLGELIADVQRAFEYAFGKVARKKAKRVRKKKK